MCIITCTVSLCLRIVKANFIIKFFPRRVISSKPHGVFYKIKVAKAAGNIKCKIDLLKEKQVSLGVNCVTSWYADEQHKYFVWQWSSFNWNNVDTVKLELVIECELSTMGCLTKQITVSNRKPITLLKQFHRYVEDF